MILKKLNIFVGMSGGFGPLAQVLPILEELDKNQFNIICNTARPTMAVLKSLGYNFLEIMDLGLPSSLVPKGQTWWDLDHYWGRFGYLDYEYVKKLTEIRLEAISSCEPDLIISQFSPPTSIVCKILRKPHISITQSCMHPNGKRVSWWKEPNETYFKTSQTVNKVLSDYKIDPIKKMEDLHKGDLTIVPSFPEFDPVNDESVVYTGPLVWESSSNYKGNPISYQKGERPLIFAYTGHMHDSAGPSGLTILQNIIDAFSNSEFDVIIATGEGQLPKNMPLLADNIILTDWVPVTQLINDCDITIHHGGHGSCMLGMQQGIQSLVIPTTSEREFNARQLHELGLGAFILPDEITPKRLFDDVYKLINNTVILNHSKEWSQELLRRGYGGAKQAAKAIERFILNSL